MTAQAEALRGLSASPPKSLRVVLAGGGHAHLAVLKDWQLNPLGSARCTLITPHRTMLYSGMVPGWIEGIYLKADLEIDIGTLADAAGVELVCDPIVGLDAARRSLTLASGRRVEYDILSLAVGGELASLPLAHARALLKVRPLEQFLTAWRSYELARSGSSQRIAVIGGGAAGVEIALAIAARFASDPLVAEIVLFAGPEGVLAGHAEEVRSRARSSLAVRGVETLNILIETKGGDGVGGGFGDFDLVIAATGTVPPSWLATSGLALGPGGGVAVGPDMRSVSHPNVLAAGDVSERTDRVLARSGVHAVKAGPVLSTNLRAIAERGKLVAHQPRKRTLYLISIGNRAAILSWGRFSAQGGWVWRLKNLIDRRFVRTYQRLSRSGRADRKRLPLHKALASASVIRIASQVSLVVGTCLNLINQGDELLAGEPVSLGRIVLNYIVPFSVAAFSGARARQTASIAIEPRLVANDPECSGNDRNER